MSNVIGIVNYGIAGNIHSIEKALKKAGAKTLIINKTEDFTKADKLVLPGVGSFKDAMKEINLDSAESFIAHNINEALDIQKKIGFQLALYLYPHSMFCYILYQLPNNRFYIHKLNHNILLD